MGNISSRFVNGDMWDGLYMSLIAFSIVFLVTAGLMFVMMALKYFSTLTDRNKPSDTAEGKPAASDAPVQPPAAVLAVPEAPARSDDGELTAVIAAAIMAMSGGAAKALAYSPVSIAGTGRGISAWRMSGIADNSLGPRG
ncbi:MAG: OadG family protein [Synergistaceae bacterium]|jgi:Na+-transporting methylmalonyl-CoA/oxaloacetate decarboxylase gamma subunit|nr:OadG family protein [Synergistaceae bacterium]